MSSSNFDVLLVIVAREAQLRSATLFVKVYSAKASLNDFDLGKKKSPLFSSLCFYFHNFLQ